MKPFCIDDPVGALAASAEPPAATCDTLAASCGESLASQGVDGFSDTTVGDMCPSTCGLCPVSIVDNRDDGPGNVEVYEVLTQFAPGEEYVEVCTRPADAIARPDICKYDYTYFPPNIGRNQPVEDACLNAPESCRTITAEKARAINVALASRDQTLAGCIRDPASCFPTEDAREFPVTDALEKCWNGVRLEGYRNALPGLRHRIYNEETYEENPTATSPPNFRSFGKINLRSSNGKEHCDPGPAGDESLCDTSDELRKGICDW